MIKGMHLDGDTVVTQAIKFRQIADGAGTVGRRALSVCPSHL